MEGILFLQLLLWGIGGWITGLVIKSAGLKLKGGHLFLMLIGWGGAGILAMLGWAMLSDGMYYEEPSATLAYGGFIGMMGGLVTIRQIAKARRKKSS